MPLLDARWWEINLGLSIKMEFEKGQLLCIFNQFSEIFRSNKFLSSYLHISGKYKVEWTMHK